MPLRSIMIAIVLALVSPVVALAGPPDFAALEDRLSAALAAYDAKTVGALWDDHFVFVFPNGRVTHKVERLAGLTPPAAQAGAALTSVNDRIEVQYQDDHLAVVTVRSRWKAGPADPGDAYIATHVWIRRGDAWRLLSAQVAHLKS